MGFYNQSCQHPVCLHIVMGLRVFRLVAFRLRVVHRGLTCIDWIEIMKHQILGWWPAFKGGKNYWQLSTDIRMTSWSVIGVRFDSSMCDRNFRQLFQLHNNSTWPTNPQPVTPQPLTGGGYQRISFMRHVTGLIDLLDLGHTFLVFRIYIYIYI